MHLAPEQILARVIDLLEQGQTYEAQKLGEESLVPVAWQAFQDKNYALSVRLWEGVVRCAPDLSQPWAYLGEALFFAGRLAHAVEAFGMALRFDPNLIDTRLNLGIALTQLGQYEGAELNLRQVLALRADNPELAIALGNCLLNTGRATEALPLLLSAAESHPKHARLQQALGTCHEALGDSEAAAAAYDKSQQLQ